MKTFLSFFSILFAWHSFAQMPELMIQTGHGDKVEYVSFSADEAKMFSVDANNVGILWDVNEGRQLHIYKDVLAGEFNADNKTLTIALANNLFRNIDFNGNTIKTLPGKETKVYLTIRGRKLDREAGVMLLDRQLINLNTGVIIKLDTKLFRSNAYASVKGKVAIGGEGGNIELFNAKDGRLIDSRNLGYSSYDYVNCLNFSKDNNLLLAVASGHDDEGRVQIIDLINNNNSKDYKYPFRISSAVLSPDGKSFIILTSKKIALIDVKSGKQIWEQNNDKHVYKIDFNNSGKKIVVTGDNISFFNAANGNTLQVIDVLNVTAAGALYVSADKKNLTSIAGQQIINWNLVSGTMDKSLEVKAGSGIVISKTADRIFATKQVSTDVNQLIEYDFKGYELEYKNPRNDKTYGKSVSFDGRYLMINNSFWNTATHEEELLSNFDYSHVQGGKFANTKNIVATHDGKTSNSLAFYEVPSGNFLYRMDDIPTTGTVGYGNYRFSNTDKYLSLQQDGGLTIINLETKKSTLLTDKPFLNRSYDYDAFTPDDKYYVFVTRQGVEFYNIEKGQIEADKIIKDDLSGLININFSKNGRYIFIAGRDGVIKLWDMQTNQFAATLYSFAKTNDWAVITPDGHFDATKTAQENMFFVKGETTIALTALFEQFYTPNLLPRILEGENFVPLPVNIVTVKDAPKVKITAEDIKRNLMVEDDAAIFNTTKEQVTIKVQADCPKDGVTEIRLFQNGKLVETTRNLLVEDENKSDKSLVKTFIVTLSAGDNRFKTIAFNTERTESKPAELTVSYKPEINIQPIVTATTLHLIVVGVNTYKNPKYSLNYALADASSVAAAIPEGAKNLFGNVNSIFLKNEEATKAGITAAFEKIKAVAKPQDLFIFYYAGHGTINDNNEFFLVPYDVTQIYGNDGALAQNGFSAALLKQMSKDIKAQKQLFILDACQSAGALDVVAGARGAPEEKAIAQLARATGTYWLTASSSDQLASEFSQLGHGSFTWCLLQAFNGDAGTTDKNLTVKILDAYLQKKVPEITQKYKGTPQYPVSFSYGNDFPLIIVK